MIKKVITNDFIYYGQCQTFDNDSYERKYTLKVYIFGLLLWSRNLNENVIRAKNKEKAIGF